jgi:hypothetical protein
MGITRLEFNPSRIISTSTEDEIIYFNDDVVAHGFAGEKKHITVHIKVRAGSFKFNAHKDSTGNNVSFGADQELILTFDNTKPNEEGIGGLHYSATSVGAYFDIVSYNGASWNDEKVVSAYTRPPASANNILSPGEYALIEGAQPWVLPTSPRPADGAIINVYAGSNTQVITDFGGGFTINGGGIPISIVEGQTYEFVWDDAKSGWYVDFADIIKYAPPLASAARVLSPGNFAYLTGPLDWILQHTPEPEDGSIIRVYAGDPSKLTTNFGGGFFINNQAQKFTLLKGENVQFVYQQSVKSWNAILGSRVFSYADPEDRFILVPGRAYKITAGTAVLKGRSPQPDDGDVIKIFALGDLVVNTDSPALINRLPRPFFMRRDQTAEFVYNLSEDSWDTSVSGVSELNFDVTFATPTAPLSVLKLFTDNAYDVTIDANQGSVSFRVVVGPISTGNIQIDGVSTSLGGIVTMIVSGDAGDTKITSIQVWSSGAPDEFILGVAVEVAPIYAKLVVTSYGKPAEILTQNAMSTYGGTPRYLFQNPRKYVFDVGMAQTNGGTTRFNEGVFAVDILGTPRFTVPARFDGALSKITRDDQYVTKKYVDDKINQVTTVHSAKKIAQYRDPIAVTAAIFQGSAHRETLTPALNQNGTFTLLGDLVSLGPVSVDGGEIRLEVWFKDAAGNQIDFFDRLFSVGQNHSGPWDKLSWSITDIMPFGGSQHGAAPIATIEILVGGRIPQTQSGSWINYEFDCVLIFFPTI